MRFAVLGPLQVRLGEKTVHMRAGPQRVLLGVLLSRAGGAVSIAELIDALWDEAPPANAVKNVQSYLSRLKRELAGTGVITLGPAGYSIALGPGDLDAQVFDAQLGQADRARRAGDLVGAAACLDRALALWRGSPYAGLEDCRFLTPEVERLTELRLHAWESRAEAELGLGRHAELLPELSAHVATHPSRERFTWLLMLALYRSGRQADALAVYQTTRSRLDDELGVEPGPTLQELHESILRNDPRLRVPHHPVREAHVMQLPRDLASFTGRGAELENLVALARSAETSETVVIGVITGMPGIGKTALAVHVAHRLRGSFPDGQLFLDLHGFTPGVAAIEPPVALDRLLRAVGMPGDQIRGDAEERSAMWRSCLADRRVLIVLDNAASEEQVKPLLPALPGSLVLITSRLRLGNLDDAQPLTLGVLAPEEAAALFSEVVGADRLSTEPAELVEEVVGRCGRLPLAIRILATRLRSRPAWTLTGLAVRLRSGRNGLHEIESGRRSAAGAFRLSYDQLDADHRRLFCLLGLHPGSDIDCHAAAALTALDHDVEQMLEALVDAHLLESRTDARYSFHDLIRLHAAERVQHETTQDERYAALDRLFRYYLHAVERAMDMYTSANMRNCPDAPAPALITRSFRSRDEAVRWLDIERPNLVSLSSCAVDRGWSKYAAKLSSCLGHYLERGFHCDDGLALHRNALRAAQASGNQVDEARALSSLGLTYRNMRSHINALSCLRSALRRLPEGGNASYQVDLLNDLGNVLIHVGYFFEAEEKCERAAELYRLAGNRTGEGRSLINLGDISRYLGRFEAAEKYGRRALELARGTNDRLTVANGLRLLGSTSCGTARHDVALDYFRRSLQESQAIGDRIGEYYSLAGTSRARRGLRQYQEALKACRQVLEISCEIGDRNGEYEAHQGLGETLVACGRAGDALSHLTVALDLSYAVQQVYDQARALDAMAAAFRELADTGKAREHGQRALGIYRRLRLPDASRMEQWLLEIEEQA